MQWWVNRIEAGHRPSIRGGLIIPNSRLPGDGNAFEIEWDKGRTAGAAFKARVFHTKLSVQVDIHHFMISNTGPCADNINHPLKGTGVRG